MIKNASFKFSKSCKEKVLAPRKCASKASFNTVLPNSGKRWLHQGTATSWPWVETCSFIVVRYGGFMVHDRCVWVPVSWSSSLSRWGAYTCIQTDIHQIQSMMVNTKLNDLAQIVQKAIIHHEIHFQIVVWALYLELYRSF